MLAGRAFLIFDLIPNQSIDLTGCGHGRKNTTTTTTTTTTATPDRCVCSLCGLLCAPEGVGMGMGREGS